MFEKIYKTAIIIIAVFLIGLSLYIILSPSKAVSQALPSSISNLGVPESHVWECTPGTNAVFIIFNKKTGECYSTSSHGDIFKKLK